MEVSVLFSEPKIPQYQSGEMSISGYIAVSVLFSEPKIPQSTDVRPVLNLQVCFSALQRAENSSILLTNRVVAVLFCFSALQRAENSSM